MTSFHPIAIFSGLGVLVAIFFQDRWNLNFKQTGIVAVVALSACFLCTKTLTYGATGRLVGIGTMSLGMLAAWLLAVSLLIKKQGLLKRAPLLFSSAVIMACCMSSELLSVAIVASLALFLFALALREASGFKSSIRLIPAVSLTMLLMFGLSGLLSKSESSVSRLAQLFSIVPFSGIQFPQSSSLSSLQKWNNSDLVVIRGYGENPPLYLVGRSFTEFDQRSFWQRQQPTKEEIHPSDQVLAETRQGPRALSLFDQTSVPDAEPGPPFRLEFPKGGNGFTFYIPQHKYGMAVDLNRIHRYSDGLLQVLAKDTFDGNYFLYPFRDGWTQHGDIPILTQEEQEQCLAIPENLTPEVALQAESVAGKVQGAGKKADFITAYLQQNFTYGYDFPFESSQSALEEFLTEKPPAHCEFFATAAALMLRTQGVPTRYINGFVMQEKSLTGNYYVVRLKHAHAWIQAYIPERGWITYDPTPPGVLDNSEKKAKFGDALLEFLSNKWRLFSRVFTLSPKELFAEAKAFLANLHWMDYLKLGILFALAYLWKRLRNRKAKHQHKNTENKNYQAGQDDLLTPTFEVFNALIQPKEWQREVWETPNQWLARLAKSDLDSKTFRRIETFLEDYVEARFRQDSSSDKQQILSEKLEALRESLGGKSLKARERPANED